MTDMTCDILLFGTMADIGPTVRDDLSAAGYKVVLEGFAQNTPRDFFGYRRGLLKALDTYRPGAVLPVGDQLAMARIAEEMKDKGSGTVFITADAESVALLDSKVRTYALAESLGIRQPRLLEVGDLDGRGEDLGVIFKRDTSFGGSGVHRPRTIDSLRHLIGHENGRPYLIEEYIEGEDLSVDCIRMDGYFRGESYLSLGRTYTQGPAERRCRTECPEAVAIAERMLDHLGYRGVCGFDFRRSPDGTLYLLEANPRFTGGLAAQIENGFDIPSELMARLGPVRYAE